MYLTDEERSWLAGEGGPALKRAMEIVVALGKIYGAERLVPVKSVQISGVSYRNIGPAGLEFLRRWAEEGARVRVPTTLNPTAMDLAAWRDQGSAPSLPKSSRPWWIALPVWSRRGSSAPHLYPLSVGNLPALGEHIAWAESSAVAYANSVLGARTNREGGPGAIAAALAGRTGAYACTWMRPAARRCGWRSSLRRARLRITVHWVHWWAGWPGSASPISSLCRWSARTPVAGEAQGTGAAMAATGAVGL
jgi:predicted aconitase